MCRNAGYCQVGQIMQAAALLKDTPKPTTNRSPIDVREHLPLRHLPAHPGSDQASGGSRRMITVENLTRAEHPPPASASVRAGLSAFTSGFAAFRPGQQPEPASRPNVYVSIDDSGW